MLTVRRYPCGATLDFPTSTFTTSERIPEVDWNRDRPDQPELARAQLAQSAAWKLPVELYSNWTHPSNDIEPQDIAQRVISDCSVCASIVVCLAHHKRFSSKVRPLGLFGRRCLNMAQLGQSSLHQYIGVNSEGSPAPCLYDAEFNFNGSSRRVSLQSTYILTRI